MSSIALYCIFPRQVQIHCLTPFQESFEYLCFQFSQGEGDVPLRTSFISPGGASLMNSAAAESFWAFEAIAFKSIKGSRWCLPVGSSTAWHSGRWALGAYKVLQLGIFLVGTMPGPNKSSSRVTDSRVAKLSGASRQGKQHHQRWRNSTAWNSSLAKTMPVTGT
jgi:hypothetical protein